MSENRSLDFYQSFDWLPVTLADAKVGDIHANTGGSITRIVRGPKKLRGDTWWKEVAVREVLISCGPDFSLKADADSVIVVGRKKGAT